MGDPEAPGGRELLDLLAEIGRLEGHGDPQRRLELLRRALAAEWPLGAGLPEGAERERLRAALLLQLGEGLLHQAHMGQAEPADEAFGVLSEAAALAERVPELRSPALRLLGMAALMRAGGRRAANVERAIDALGTARELAGEAGDRFWGAELDRLLAVAYLGRLEGDRAQSLEVARRFAERAAATFDREREPHQWASARSILGESLRLQPGRDRVEDLERAAAALEEAAEVKREHGDAAERAEALAAVLEVRRERAAAIESREGRRPGGTILLGHRRVLAGPEPEVDFGGRPAREEAPPEPGAEFDAALGELESARDDALAERRPPRWVGTGFAAVEEPAEPLAADRPLEAGRPYLFWFEIGDRPPAGAIEAEPARLHPELAAGAELDVVLFGFEGGLELAPGADVGRLTLTAGGAGRLDFPVRTPERAGPARLRCNLYHRGLLLQSRLVTAWVAEAPPEGEAALAAVLDFNLSAGLDPAALAAHGEVDLALLVNDDGEGVHGLRIWGGPEVKVESTLGEGALDDLIEQSRGALRRASWGSEEEWGEPEEGDERPAAPRRAYRYHGEPPPGALRDDLVLLAIRGYRFYAAALGALEGDGAAGRALGARLRAPGRVQIVERRSAGREPVALPAALFYDFLNFDSNLPPGEYRLCPDFERALAAGEDLAETPCFEGRCPVRDDPARERSTVCPSGFWGFRHALGLPASASAAGDAPAEIVYDGAPDLTVAVSLDPAFVLRQGHEDTLRALRPGLGWARAASRQGVLDLLRAGRPHLVYFYCHGGLAGSLPYLLVGPPGERGITPDNLFPILWERPRPLVVLNGCHTTALSPRRAFRFVDALVRNSQAAGVLGTEITVFEQLARDFAESCLRRFVADELPIGEAVRRARLDLLARGNPLGLVYVPYVLPGLRLRAAG